MNIKSFWGNDLARGSLILFICMNFFNLLNYAFQFSMAKLLGPAEYGVLAVLMSFIYIFSIPSETIQTVLSRYTSNFNLNSENGKIKHLISESLKNNFYISSTLFLIFIPIAFFLSDFLRISYSLILISGLMIFGAFLLPIPKGILQGKKEFPKLGINMVFEGAVKLSLAIILVLVGFGVYGAIFSVVLSVLIAFAAALLVIRDSFLSKEVKTNIDGLRNYSFAVLIAITTIVLFYSADIILAKRFFSPEIAGVYSFISLLGKGVFFGNFAISKAMFPISSEKFDAGNKTKKIIFQTSMITLIISVFALLIYGIFPERLISILSFGSADYIIGGNILVLLGLSFVFLSFTNLNIMYALSLRKTSRIKFLLLFIVLQIILLFLFHQSLTEFSLVILFSNVIMFLYSLFLVKI